MQSPFTIPHSSVRDSASLNKLENKLLHPSIERKVLAVPSYNGSSVSLHVGFVVNKLEMGLVFIGLLQFLYISYHNIDGPYSYTTAPEMYDNPDQPTCHHNLTRFLVGIILRE
jgi:hypothetical protein